jgi:hypothetical protein
MLVRSIVTPKLGRSPLFHVLCFDSPKKKYPYLIEPKLSTARLNGRSVADRDVRLHDHGLYQQ